jgi:hypothetical protein
MFWVISVYFNIRNTLPKSGTFLLGYPVFQCMLERTDAIRNEVLEPITFVLAYPTVSPMRTLIAYTHTHTHTHTHARKVSLCLSISP